MNQLEERTNLSSEIVQRCGVASRDDNVESLLG